MSYDQRAELAQAIHRKTDGGNKIVDFLNDVLDQNLPDVRLTHRLQSARLLTRRGHFPKAELFIERHRQKRARGKSGGEQKRDSEFDSALQEIILAEAGPAFVAQWLIDVMQGRTPAIESGIDTFKVHHRMRAVRELLARGYDRDYTSPVEAETVRTVTENDRPRVSSNTHDATVMPSFAGIHSSDDPCAPLSHNHTEIESEDSEPMDEPIDYVAMAKEIVANLDPSELEEEPPSPHKPNYTMWEIIRKQPKPAITEEQARIGAARFHERIERQRRWRESGVKTPARKDHNYYDDG